MAPIISISDRIRAAHCQVQYESVQKQVFHHFQQSSKMNILLSASEASLRVAIGFTAGQIQIIDMATRDDSRRSLQKINDEKNNDNSMITAIQWVPNSLNKLIAGYASGNMYLFDTEKNDAIRTESRTR